MNGYQIGGVIPGGAVHGGAQESDSDHISQAQYSSKERWKSLH